MHVRSQATPKRRLLRLTPHHYSLHAAGLRKYALLTGHGLPGSPPASPSATSPRSPLPPTSGRNGSASSGSAEAAPLPSPTSAAAPAGLSLTLLQEVTRYVPHGFSTRAVAKHLVLPLASQAKTALCEVPGLLHRKQINPASVHIVHGWDAPFADLSTLMQEYLTEQGLPTTVRADAWGSQRMHSTLDSTKRTHITERRVTQGIWHHQPTAAAFPKHPHHAGSLCSLFPCSSPFRPPCPPHRRPCLWMSCAPTCTTAPPPHSASGTRAHSLRPHPPL